MTRLYLAAGIGRPEMYTRIFSGFPGTVFERDQRSGASQKTRTRRKPFRHRQNRPAVQTQRPRRFARRVPKILPQIPHARLLLVGDGALRNEIENQVRALGLEGKVIFTGLVPPGEVPRYVGIMDCLAHLSSREALSRALPQALAAGKPVVAYDFDGADEVCLEGETGFLVRTGDTATVAQRLLQLANDAPLRERLGRRGQQFVRENFAVEKMVDNHLPLYLKLAAER
jgi:glycosyltransferase involved in cell wall biosynthesis